MSDNLTNAAFASASCIFLIIRSLRTRLSKLFTFPLTDSETLRQSNNFLDSQCVQYQVLTSCARPCVTRRNLGTIPANFFNYLNLCQPSGRLEAANHELVDEFASIHTWNITTLKIRKLAAVLILAGALNAQAITTNVTWEDDSRTAMTLRMEGNGAPRADETFNESSPSGLWNLSGFLYASPYRDGPLSESPEPPDTVLMGFLAYLSFEGVFLTNNHGFDDRFPIDGPLISFEGWEDIERFDQDGNLIYSKWMIWEQEYLKLGAFCAL
jgi:hypothetical protein